MTAEPKEIQSENPFSGEKRIRKWLFDISAYSDKILFSIGLIVVSFLILEYGFFIPDSWSQIIDGITRIVIWFFVVHYILKLIVATLLTFSFRTVVFLKRHFKAKWFQLFLALAILTQNAIYFNWFGIPYFETLLNTVNYRFYTEMYIAVTQLSIVMGFLADFLRYSSRLAALKFHPSQSFVLSFLILILVGAVFLMMPKAVVHGKNLQWIDALFTATSALCVTGLTVVDTGTYFTVMGQTVILVLVQLGGLGFIAFATFFAMFFGDGVSFKERIMLKDVLNEASFDEAVKTLKQIFVITLAFELAGAVVLYWQWYGWKVSSLAEMEQQIFYAVFHSVSAFCNAGFALWPDSLMRNELQWTGKAVIMVLIVVGGLGFSVLRNMTSYMFDKLLGRFIARLYLLKTMATNAVKTFIRRNSDEPAANPNPETTQYSAIRNILEHYRKELSMQSKFVLTISGLLIIGGTLLVAVFEWNNVLDGFSFHEKIFHAVFQAVTTRTAGFNTIDIAALTLPVALVMIFLMFVGASPGSTGGGIKTTTFGIMLVSSFGNLRGQDRVVVFGKLIPSSNIVRALMVITFSVICIFIAVFTLSITEAGLPIFDLVFETVSAFATVGLTRGITPHLSEVGKLVIILCMFIGRVGTLSIALAVSASQPQNAKTDFPEESVMIG
ncbi:hypothetical protein K1X84_11860 [bacterium]|nr:hypothetical protein [bacterium]